MHVVSFASSEIAVESVVGACLVLLAPVGSIYGWHFYFTRIWTEPATWRHRISGLSLTLASLGALLWPITMKFAPEADWKGYRGVAQQVAFIDSWERVAIRTLLLGFILCFFGRPRLIAPIAAACVGTAVFWAFSTIRSSLNS
jgi:hypothetical protein